MDAAIAVPLVFLVLVIVGLVFLLWQRKRREAFTVPGTALYFQNLDTEGTSVALPVGKTMGSAIPAALRTGRFSISVEPKYEVAIVNMNGTRSRIVRNTSTQPINTNVLFRLEDTDLIVVNPVTPPLGPLFKLSVNGQMVKSAPTGFTNVSTKNALRAGTDVIFQLSTQVSDCAGNTVGAKGVTSLLNTSRKNYLGASYAPYPNRILSDALLTSPDTFFCNSWQFEPQSGGGFFIRRVLYDGKSEYAFYDSAKDQFSFGPSGATKFFVEPVTETDATLASIRAKVAYH